MPVCVPQTGTFLNILYSSFLANIFAPLNLSLSLSLSLPHISSYFVTEAVPVIIVVVGAQTRCALLHSMRDLKYTQMNMQRSLILELILYEFEQDRNAREHLLCVGE